MAEGDLFIERIAAEQGLEVPLVQLSADLDDLHHHRVTGIGERLAVAEDEGDVAAALSGGAECVTVDRRVRADHVGQGGFVEGARVL